MPTPGLIPLNAVLSFTAFNAEPFTNSAIGQIRIKNSAIYGTGSFTPPPEAFYVPPEPASGGSGWLLVPSDSSFSPVVRGIPPFVFGQISEIPIVRGVGPLGTFAVVVPIGIAEAEPVEGIINQSSLLRCPVEEGEPGVNILEEPSSRSFTLECMFKLPPSVYEPRAPFNQLYFSFGQYGGIDVSRRWTLTNPGPPGSGLQQEALTPYVNLFMGWGNLSGGRYLSSDVLGEFGDDFSNADDILPDLDSEEWRHIAIVQTPGNTPDSRTVSYYFNGRRIRYVQNVSDPDVLPVWGGVQVLDIGLSAGFIAGAAEPGGGGESFESCAGHGFRFTPRALYTGPTYTPPTSITQLA
jgi:hypothetical protein